MTFFDRTKIKEATTTQLKMREIKWSTLSYPYGLKISTGNSVDAFIIEILTNFSNII